MRTDPAEVTALAERLNVGVIASNAGKGIVADSNPLSLGGGIISPAVHTYLAEAEVVLAIGTDLLIIAAKSLLGFVGEMQAVEGIDYTFLGLITLLVADDVAEVVIRFDFRIFQAACEFRLIA